MQTNIQELDRKCVGLTQQVAVQDASFRDMERDYQSRVQKLAQTVKQEQEARKLVHGELLAAQESLRHLSAKYDAEKQLFQQSY